MLNSRYSLGWNQKLILIDLLILLGKHNQRLPNRRTRQELLGNGQESGIKHRVRGIQSKVAKVDCLLRKTIIACSQFRCKVIFIRAEQPAIQSMWGLEFFQS